LRTWAFLYEFLYDEKSRLAAAYITILTKADPEISLPNGTPLKQGKA